MLGFERKLERSPLSGIVDLVDIDRHHLQSGLFKIPHSRTPLR